MSAAEILPHHSLKRAVLTELHLSVYWHTVHAHISCGSLAGLIANKSPVVQECNYLLTQIILLAGSRCLCSGSVTPGTECSLNLTLTPPCILTSGQSMVFMFVCINVQELKISSYLLILPPGPCECGIFFSGIDAL